MLTDVFSGSYKMGLHKLHCRDRLGVDLPSCKVRLTGAFRSQTAVRSQSVLQFGQFLTGAARLFKVQVFSSFGSLGCEPAPFLVQFGCVLSRTSETGLILLTARASQSQKTGIGCFPLNSRNEASPILTDRKRLPLASGLPLMVNQRGPVKSSLELRTELTDPSSGGYGGRWHLDV